MIAVQISWEAKPGLLKRTAVSLGVAQDPSTNIAVQWVETNLHLVHT